MTNDYILLMHDDVPPGRRADGDWGAYIARLRAAGAFEGGSALGDGVCVRRTGDAPAITAHVTGYVRIRAASLAAAQRLVVGNPVYEAGGTVEVRELPRDGEAS